MKNITGFTLMELLLVIAVIMIIAGGAVSRLSTGFGGQRLDIDIKKLASNIGLAQQYAMGQKDEFPSYGITFYSGGYRVVSDDGKGKSTPVVVPSSVNTNGDIPFSDGVSAKSPKDITFNSKGSITTGQDIEIILTNGSTDRRITVTQLSGHVKID